MINSIKKFWYIIIISIIFSFSFAKAEVVYTDIKPDTTVTEPIASGQYFVDMNNDGTYEFELRNFFSGGTHSYVEIYFKNDMGPIYTIIDNTKVPMPLNEGDDISNDNNSWHTYDMGMSNLKRFSNGGDKYIALKFKIGSSYHLGWIRVNIIINGTTGSLTVKDYAYENEAGKSILAGDKGSTNVADNSDASLLNIFPNPVNDIVKINIPAVLLFNDIIISNSNGMEVERKTFSALTGSQSVELSTKGLPSGIYYCTLNNGKEKIVKSFVIIR